MGNLVSWPHELRHRQNKPERERVLDAFSVRTSGMKMKVRVVVPVPADPRWPSHAKGTKNTCEFAAADRTNISKKHFPSYSPTELDA